MNFSKSDKIFELASIEPIERRELIKKFKKNRSMLLWTFWAMVSSVVVGAVWTLSQVAPILRGDYSSYDPAVEFNRDAVTRILGLFMVFGVASIYAAAHADHRVKMLILLDSLERNLPDNKPAEHGEGGKASPATS